MYRKHACRFIKKRNIQTFSVRIVYSEKKKVREEENNREESKRKNTEQEEDVKEKEATGETPTRQLIVIAKVEPI